jgi:hypothetical protein
VRYYLDICLEGLNKAKKNLSGEVVIGQDLIVGLAVYEAWDSLNAVFSRIFEHLVERARVDRSF